MPKVVQDKELSDDSLRLDDSKVKFFTGLPSYSVRKAMFDFISPYVKEHHHSALSNFQQFLMKPIRSGYSVSV